MKRAGKGKLIVISGPSGAGKSTVIGKVMELRDDVCFSVSATTRPSRRGEREGLDYFFVTKERFEDMLVSGRLLEHAEYVGNYYGTPREYVEKRQEEGMNVVLDIEVQGAAQVKAISPDAITVFIAPPGSETLEQRLRGRKTDSEEKIQHRLKQAKTECAQAGHYDYIVINDDPMSAAKELDAIITAENCRMPERIKFITEVLLK